MHYMFANARAFNADIYVWNTSKVTDTKGIILSEAHVFNGDYPCMFEGAHAFNGDILVWNVSMSPIWEACSIKFVHSVEISVHGIHLILPLYSTFSMKLMYSTEIFMHGMSVRLLIQKVCFF